MSSATPEIKRSEPVSIKSDGKRCRYKVKVYTSSIIGTYSYKKCGRPVCDGHDECVEHREYPCSYPDKYTASADMS